jgi:hypothetical protein
MEFNVGDLLIENWNLSPEDRRRLDWVPRLAVAMQGADATSDHPIPVLIDGKIIWVQPYLWKVAQEALDDLCKPVGSDV